MTTQAMLDDRYGRTPRPGRRRAFWIAIAALAAASVIALGWMTVASTLDQVGFNDTGFEVVDERTVHVAFQVTPPPGASFACAIQAMDENHGVVGWRVIEVEGSDQVTRPFVETLPTVALATTGVVHSCWTT